MHPDIARPDSSEYAAYYGKYVDAIAHTLTSSGIGDIRDVMDQQCDELEAMVRDISDAQANLAYAPGKWTLKESLVHVCDTERIFSYRALRIARGDGTPLSSFNQDDYVPESRATRRTMADILAEFRLIRANTVALVNSFDEIAIDKRGTASGNAVSTRAVCWIIAGHAEHHIAVTRDRYVPALSGAK
ncbi:MAG: DinB family protein [Gemmatimonadaceae bacterium]